MVSIESKPAVGPGGSQPPLIGLLGAGRMGRGIALAFAFAGHPAVLIDIKERTPADFERLRQEALDEVAAGLATLVRIGALDEEHTATVAKRVRVVGREDAPAALARVEILFEGVPETLEAKRSAFEFACRHLRPQAIVASTTSTILSTELADMVADPGRFLNAHWLNPAFLIPVVELSPHEGTREDVVAALSDCLRRLGKRPIRCAATPGYVVPRLQSLIMNEAARMVEDGVATPEAIDEAIRFGFGFRYTTIGAVEFIDFGGLDILYHANRYLTEVMGERYRLAPIIERYMREGRLGLRSGRGFYDYPGADAEAMRTAVLQRQYHLLQYLEAAPKFDAALSSD
ncbi:MAG: 3-hydroxybutyryl-CoA dehydrogenase [Pigmentiphaga sp.]